MANIPQYDAGNLAIRPTETGVESFAAAGRRIGAFYNQEAEGLTQAGARIGRGVTEAGDVALAHADQQQIAAGAATGANLFSDQLDKKNAAIKAIDPNDPLYGQKVELAVKQWREEQLEPALQDFAGSFSTQRSQEWAQHFIDRTRDTMFLHSTADIATAAKVGIDNAAHTTVNTASATVFKDPTMLDSQIGLVEHGITGLVQNNPVKGVDAAAIQSELMEKAKEKIVKSAIQGAILNGQPWDKIANDPRYAQYVDGAELKMFDRAAKTQARASLAYDKQIAAFDRAKARDDVESARNDIWQKNVSIDTNGNVSINPQFFKDAVAIPMQHSNAPNAVETARTLLDWGTAVQSGKKDLVSDPKIMGDLTGRLFSAENPTTDLQVLRAEADHQISHQDGAIVRQQIKDLADIPQRDLAFKDTMQAAKDSFTYAGSNPADDPFGSKSYARFVQAFLPEYLKETRAGTLKPNALDLRDPTSLISQSIQGAKGPLQTQIKTDAPARFVPPPTWFSNGRGEYSDPLGNIYDANGKATGRRINPNGLTQWPTIPISQ